MMGSEVVGDFLSASRGLKQIEMHRPNASLLGILTPHYCSAPETHLMEDVSTALLFLSATNSFHAIPHSQTGKEIKIFSNTLKRGREKIQKEEDKI